MMRPWLRLAVVLAAVLLGPGACAVLSSEGPPQTSPASPDSPPPTTAAPSTGGGGTASAPPTPGTSAALPGGLRERPTVAAAIDDAAGRQGVRPEQVAIAAWSPVTWNDGSLGCPQKGMSYTQALVEGELLVLRVDSALLQYHARTAGPFTYCASPSADYTVGG